MITFTGRYKTVFSVLNILKLENLRNVLIINTHITITNIYCYNNNMYSFFYFFFYFENLQSVFDNTISIKDD